MEQRPGGSLEGLVGMDKYFWKNKKVLITGNEGFLGSNLTRYLLHNTTAHIVGLDIKVKRNETIFTNDDYAKIAVFKGSVSNQALVKEIIERNNIEVIFHLAAEAIVASCMENPVRGFTSNIKGTWTILEAGRHSKTIQAIIIASSDKAYGNHEKLPYTEETPLIGIHPYDVSKSCADLLAMAYYHTYGLPVVVTRCGNIFGPGDFNFSRIVPDTFRCALENKTLSIRSNGKFTRDYVYVDDIVNGYVTLAEKLEKNKLAGQAFNFSDENPISVLKLVTMIYSITGKKPSFKILNQAQKEIPDQYLSSSKARDLLGWKPRCSLRDGLMKTHSWYKEYYQC